MATELRYGDLETMRRLNPAWRLLRADHAPFVISFLHRAFLATSRRQIPESLFLGQLEDHLAGVRATAHADDYGLSARAYLDKWSSTEYGWVRVSFELGNDEPRVDLTPHAERAIEFVTTLEKGPAFVGTQSRMRTIIDLLRKISRGTESDPRHQLEDLERQRKEIEDEMLRISRGEIRVVDPMQVKEYFQLVEENALKLLSDLRRVEEKFRALDLDARKRIAEWDAGKGTLLTELLGGSDSIQQSEQGRSFVAFWDFLMSPERQDELHALLNNALENTTVRSVQQDPRLRHITSDWMGAADQAQRTVSRLSEQLRRFLDDQSWMQNKRIHELIRSIERKAGALAEVQPEGDEVMSIAALGADVVIPWIRPLYWPPTSVSLADDPVTIGESDDGADALYNQVFVDQAALEANVIRCLNDQEVVTLGEVLVKHPLEHGVAEIVGYLRLAADPGLASISDEKHEVLTWIDHDEHFRRATVPLIIYRR